MTKRLGHTSDCEIVRRGVAPYFECTCGYWDQQKAQSITFPIRLANLISRCKFPEHHFEIAQQEGGRWFLRMRLPQKADAREAPTAQWWNGRWFRLSPHMTDGEIVQTAFLAVLTFLEHEAREAFTFDGEAVMGPHLDIHELVRLHKEGKAVQARAEKERVSTPKTAI